MTTNTSITGLVVWVWSERNGLESTRRTLCNLQFKTEDNHNHVKVEHIFQAICYKIRRQAYFNEVYIYFFLRGRGRIETDANCLTEAKYEHLQVDAKGWRIFQVIGNNMSLFVLTDQPSFTKHIHLSLRELGRNTLTADDKLIIYIAVVKKER